MLLDIGVGRHEGRLAIDQPAITGEHARLVNPQTVLIVLEDKAVRAGGHDGAALAGVDSGVSGPEPDQPVAGKMKRGPGVRRLAIAARMAVRVAHCCCSSHAGRYPASQTSSLTRLDSERLLLNG